ncbi:MAG: T9SS C-terminal target domain-containing protein [Chitinophagaceae bacterium]|nr:MAG: T9SS C-terminal target domain-containing protein [Chitinophagaceae bacterium]
MKQTLVAFAILILSCYILSAQNFLETDQVILKLKNENSGADKIIGEKVDLINREYNAVSVKKIYAGINSNQLIYVIKFPEGTNIKEVIDAYYNTNEVKYAEPDHIGSGGGKPGFSPNDSLFYRQWGLRNDGTFSLSPSTAGADIDMEKAWNIEQGDSNIIVAIIDTGTDLLHPEFEGRIWINHNEIPDNGIDNDSNGFINDINGWNFVNDSNDPTDDHGHGTNVTGIIGANGNNSIGYAGVDWNCKLMILKGLAANNQGYYSWWAEAIYYAVDNGARVINMSIGGTSTSVTLENAVNYALDNDVVVVACMMNTNSNTVFYPAGFNGVIAVGSTNSDDTRSNPFFWSPVSGSNYGSHISVVAPGNYIYGLDYQSNTNYDSYWGGTSQAAPLVAGLASLLLAQNPSLKPAEIKSIIETTAEDLIGDPNEDIPGWDQYYGHGRINAFRALSNFTGIQSIDTKTNNSFLLFPNPTNHTFTVITPPAAKQINIFNSLGQLILNKNIQELMSENFQILENGIYYIQITTDSEIISQKLFVNN